MRREKISGSSYEHAVAFWIGVLLTAGGVVLQLPMYYMARTMHYHVAGMPVTNEMLIGMGMMFLGLGVTTYSLFPRTPPARREFSKVSITPLDDARLRPAHLALLIVMSIAVTIDGMKPAAFAFVIPGAEAEYGLKGPLNPHAHALPIGLYPLSGITGTMLGAFIWGWMGDRIGRRASILLAAILFIASSTCGTMPQYWMNLVCCFAMGLAAGGMLPIGFSLVSETVPRRHRGWMMVIIGSNILTAFLLVSWLASTLASPAHFGWRLLWLIGLPTGLLMVGLNHWIPESPRYLLERGRDEEARAVMRRYGAVLVDPVPEVATPRERAIVWRDMFSRTFLGLTVAIVLLGLSIGATQYGFQQWMPSNLERLGYSPVAASALLRNATIIGFPFILPVALLYHRWGSKKTTLSVTALIASGLAVFILVGSQVTGNRALILALLVVPVCGVNILNAVLAAYTAEVYPTAIRARGSGLSAGATKAGGVVILALVLIAFAAPSIRMTAVLGTVPMAAALIVLAVFGPETRHKRLEQITAEELAARPANAALATQGVLKNNEGQLSQSWREHCTSQPNKHLVWRPSRCMTEPRLIASCGPRGQSWRALTEPISPPPSGVSGTSSPAQRCFLRRLLPICWEAPSRWYRKESTRRGTPRSGISCSPISHRARWMNLSRRSAPSAAA
jgi:putative MFS transporter